uniref:Fucosyltransferase n=1 Tax=Neogobius melanostomus TaxID=47308 RepID=A0A8C6WTY0_9GOBI
LYTAELFILQSQFIDFRFSMGLHIRPVPACSRTNQDNSTLKSDNETHYTTVLIWTWPFQKKFDTDCGVFGVQKCYLTDDRSIYNKADGVFFHHRDINLKDLPKIPGPCFQKWVWVNMESPDNTLQFPWLDDLFNLTCNYRLDSNIPVPYGYLVPRNSEDPDFQLPTKDKLVCWIISNWNQHLLRVQYYNQLKDHIQISSYGKAFGNPLSNEDYKNVLSSCKFYLAFENSVHKDYITEKLFHPMSLGSVPIVLGPPRDNYMRQIPADSFIHVNDFASPKELAERLHHLNKDPEEYMRYFKWTKEYKVTSSWFGKEHACRTCDYIQKHRRSQVCHNLIEWFWG